MAEGDPLGESVSKLGEYDRGRLASKALKKNFLKLSKVLATEDISSTIFSQDLISEELFDDVLTAPKRSGIGARLVRVLQEKVQANPDNFNVICEILRKNGSGDLSSLLKETYEKLAVEPVKGNLKVPDFSQEFQQMKEDLELYTRQLSKGIGNADDIDKLIKSLTTLTIQNAFKNGESLESVRNQMHALSYTTFSIPPRLGAWAMQEVEDVYKAVSVTGTGNDVEEPSKPSSPIKPQFSSDSLLYHSSLCCLAVNSCTTANFDEFLSANGHEFTEAKLSISQDRVNVDRYMIAEQGSTVYVAFQSEPDLSHWLQSSYSSFDEGFRKQTNRIPLRFFEEQLADDKEIVFTGYGFGGMLACYVAASLWKESFITLDILERSVMCITFGQPLIGISFNFKTIATPLFEKFQSSIHAFFDRGDLFPALLCHLCGYISDTEVKQHKEWQAPTSTQTLRSTFAKRLLNNLSTFTEKKSYSAVMTSSHVTQAQQEIKDMLKKSCEVKNLEPDVPFVEAIVLSSVPGSNQILDHQESSKNLLVAVRQELMNLDLTSLNQVGMSGYHKMIKKYIGKEVIPTQLGTSKVTLNGYLKPDVRAIEFHKYPSEHAVILEGENLWFCHEIRLGEEENIIYIEDRADDVSRHFIQFNYPPTEKTDRIVSDNGIVKVALKSHFSNPVRRKIRVKQEPHEFSVRQIQLAKYTPTELIRLAYWSALLEQLPDCSQGQPPSRRLKKIAEFLQEAVIIVPLESILSAIAFAEDKTAFKCAKALLQSHPVIPPSAEAIVLSQIGAVRLHTGVNGGIISGLINRTVKQVRAEFDFSHFGQVSVVALTSTKIQVSMNILVPLLVPIEFPFRRPKYSDVTRKRFNREPSFHRDILYQDLHVPSTLDVSSLVPAGAEKDADLAKQLTLYSKKLFDGKKVISTLNNLNIEHIYPINTTRRHSIYHSTLQSPLEVLNSARNRIASFAEELIEEETVIIDDGLPSNEKMLNLLREIDENNLRVCAALLGSFMEQQISIPLIKSELDTANILAEKSSPVAIGAWVLFSSGYAGVLSKLTSRHGSPLLVQIADYISGILSDGLEKPSKSTSKYDAKLQFLLHGIKKTVSCSSQYISYSLERQLRKNLKFKEPISVKELIEEWDTIFEGDALSLVARSHRPLTARWLKWALLIHNLREAMAEYTCVGVTGLVNSGKSQLVSNLFGVKTLVGTTGHRRTTIPMLYNLDGIIDGLDVIDFPGVDDSEHSIPELASLLLGLLQIVIFVVDYKRVFSDASTHWLKFLGEKSIPVIVCLTFGDQLYFEIEERQKGKLKEPAEIAEDIRRIIGSELYNTRRKLREKVMSSLEFLSYYCFHLPEIQRSRKGDLKQAGVLSVEDVGDQVAKLFKQKSMTDLSVRLRGYQHHQDQFAFLSTGSDAPAQKPNFPLIRARNISNVPFLEEPTIFKCDASGGEYNISSHGISLQVPPGAIPRDETIHFEIAVTLIGPFKFGSGKRPISPVLWLCTHEDVTFQSPIKIKLPHFLGGLTDLERLNFNVEFAKADHPTIGSVEAPLPELEFKSCQGKSQFDVGENGSFGLLQTTHCCFFCIQANQSRDLALRAGYCLTRVEYQPSPTRHIVHFCATFQLDTCLDALQKQYPEDIYTFVSTNFMFKVPEDSTATAELQLLHPAVDRSLCMVALEPKKGRIRITEIDFWTANVDIEGMKLRQKNKTYPPRVRLTLGLKSMEELVIPIEFKGCTEDSDLDMDLMVQAQPCAPLESMSAVATPSKVNDEKLDMGDHFNVTQYLSDLNCDQIIKLGGALGLYYPNLKKMKNPLEDMVEAWLRKDDQVLSKSGHPSWKSLVNALEVTKNVGIAEEIKKEKLVK